MKVTLFFHLKTADTAKQIKLPFVRARWAHYSLTWSIWLFTTCNNPSTCPIHSQIGKLKQMQASQQGVGRASGRWRHCNELALSLSAPYIRICKGPHPSSAARTWSLCHKSPLSHPTLPFPSSLGTHEVKQSIFIKGIYNINM